MASDPGPIEKLMERLVRLPGIGRRGAERVVAHLLDAPPGEAKALGEALIDFRAKVRTCERCGSWCEDKLCAICSDPRREEGRLCVVERPADLKAFEQSGAFHGRYHVLGGTLSPLHGVTPDHLNIDPLLRRIREEEIKEVIVATSPTVEGDATAHYLAQQLAPLGVEVTRIGIGVPLGANLSYADAGTLKLALEGRRKLEG